MIARLPAQLRDDPRSQQEIGRLLLEAVVPRAIEGISSAPAHPVFLPSLNATLNVHQPNSDTIYINADIADDGVYRIRGDRGSLRILRILRMAQRPAITGEVHVDHVEDLRAQGDVDKLKVMHTPGARMGQLY
jgi:hypothetical protein